MPNITIESLVKALENRGCVVRVMSSGDTRYVDGITRDGQRIEGPVPCAIFNGRIYSASWNRFYDSIEEYLNDIGIDYPEYDYTWDTPATGREAMLMGLAYGPIVGGRMIELGFPVEALEFMTDGATPEQALGDYIRWSMADYPVVTVDNDHWAHWDNELTTITYRRRPGVWVSQNPGRYFQDANPNASGPEIDALVQREKAHHGHRELMFTRDPEVIRERYLNYRRQSPSDERAVSPLGVSCMVGFENWGTHPVEFYGHEVDGRCALAYTMADGKTLARAIVNTETREYGRVYASNRREEGFFRKILEDSGYTHNIRCLEGLTFKVPYNGNSRVCPYIDGISYGELDGDFLTLGEGNVCVQETSGYLEVSNYTCYNCGRAVDYDLYQAEGECYCQDCFDRYFRECDRCGKVVHIDSAQWIIVDGERYCSRYCAKREGAIACEECGKWFWADDTVVPENAPDDFPHVCSRRCASSIDTSVQCYTDGTCVYHADDTDDDIMFIPEPCWTPNLPNMEVTCVP